MIPTLASLSKALTGKTIIGLVAVTMGAGAAAAAGAPVPVLGNSGTDQTVKIEDDQGENEADENHDEADESHDEADESHDEADESHDEADENRDEADESHDEADDVEQMDATVVGDEADAEHPDNHGKVVSEFVHDTELTGCEKGQAVASIASGKEKDATHCKTDSTDGETAVVDEVTVVEEKTTDEPPAKDEARDDARDEAKQQRRAQHEVDKAERASNQANRGK